MKKFDWKPKKGSFKRIQENVTRTILLENINPKVKSIAQEIDKLVQMHLKGKPKIEKGGAFEKAIVQLLSKKYKGDNHGDGLILGQSPVPYETYVKIAQDGEKKGLDDQAISRNLEIQALKGVKAGHDGWNYDHQMYSYIEFVDKQRSSGYAWDASKDWKMRTSTAPSSGFPPPYYRDGELTPEDKSEWEEGQGSAYGDW
jgi:hypothetical protein